MILSIILGITLIWGIGWLFGNGCMHFSFLFSDIIQNHRYFHELWRSENTITQFEEVCIEEYRYECAGNMIGKKLDYYNRKFNKKQL